MNTYTTYVDLGYGDIWAAIDYDYQPAERMTQTYPGCEASVEVTGITGRKGCELHLSEAYIEDLEDEILEHELNKRRDEAEATADHLYELEKDRRAGL